MYKEPKTRPKKVFDKGPDWEFQGWDIFPYWGCYIAGMEVRITYFYKEDPKEFFVSFCRFEGYDLKHANGVPLDEAVEFIRDSFFELECEIKAVRS